MTQTKPMLPMSAFQTRAQRINSHVSTAQIVWHSGRDLYARGRSLRETYLNKRLWQLSIDANDSLYRLVSRWVLEQLEFNQRKLVGITIEHNGALPDSLHTFYDPKSGPLEFHLGRHLIKVSSSTAARAKTSDDDLIAVSSDFDRYSKPAMYLQTYSAEGRNALLEALTELVRTSGRQPGMYYLTPWSTWDRRDLTARPIQSVVLADGLAERALEDLRIFLDAEEVYGRMGIPWHRGYLFHGPPGTGKTSLAAALAHEAGLNVYNLSLSSMKSDSNFSRHLNEIQPRSILLLEDLDVFAATHDREAESGEVSMSGLLNALDGIVTPHGLVTIMTTNHIESLDPALLRAGRADFQAKIDLPTSQQVLDIIRWFMPEVFDQQDFPPPSGDISTDVSTAEITGVIKENMHHGPSVVARELTILLTGEDISD